MLIFGIIVIGRRGEAWVSVFFEVIRYRRGVAGSLGFFRLGGGSLLRFISRW